MVVLSKWGRASACGVLLLACACGPLQSGNDDPAKSADKVDTGGTTKQPTGQSAQPVANDVAIDPPGKLKDTLLSSDILVYGKSTLDKDTIAKIKAIKGVETVEQFTMGSFFVEDRQVTYAAVHPDTFRRFASPGTAQTQAVWDRVAGGEIAVDPVHRQEARAGRRQHAARQRGVRQDRAHRGLRQGAQQHRPVPDRRHRELQVGRQARRDPQGQRDDRLPRRGLAGEHPQAAQEVRRQRHPDRDPRPEPRPQGLPHRRPDRWLGRQGGRVVLLPRELRRHGHPRPGVGRRQDHAPRPCRSSGGSPATG